MSGVCIHGNTPIDYYANLSGTRDDYDEKLQSCDRISHKNAIRRNDHVGRIQLASSHTAGQEAETCRGNLGQLRDGGVASCWQGGAV